MDTVHPESETLGALVATLFLINVRRNLFALLYIFVFRSSWRNLFGVEWNSRLEILCPLERGGGVGRGEGGEKEFTREPFRDH